MQLHLKNFKLPALWSELAKPGGLLKNGFPYYELVITSIIRKIDMNTKKSPTKLKYVEDIKKSKMVAKK